MWGIFRVGVFFGFWFKDFFNNFSVPISFFKYLFFFFKFQDFFLFILFFFFQNFFCKYASRRVVVSPLDLLFTFLKLIFNFFHSYDLVMFFLEFLKLWMVQRFKKLFFLFQDHLSSNKLWNFVFFLLKNFKPCLHFFPLDFFNKFLAFFLKLFSLLLPFSIKFNILFYFFPLLF